jgi:hypothetical protein
MTAAASCAGRRSGARARSRGDHLRGGRPGGAGAADGWDANGEPVGRPWPTPHIQVTAVSEDQTDNVWRALQPMIELGDIAADIPDTGLTRINLPGRRPDRAGHVGAISRLGQRVTFAVQDQTGAG